MLKKIPALLLAAMIAMSVYSQEKGAPIFSDSFDTTATFAENWVPKGKNVKSEGGRIVLQNGGTLNMRAPTPLEFYAEMDVTMDMSQQPDKSKWGSAFCGFMIEGFRFQVLPSGNTWMIWKLPGWEKANGKQVAIDGFELGKPFKLTLIRKVENNVATYRFKANGKDAGNFSCAAPVALAGGAEAYSPLDIFSYNVNMAIDNFSLCSVKRSSDDSPNVIFNSSFEHSQDGFPLYFCRSCSFKFRKSTTVPYEDFINTWTLDTTEKHSGNQSLKIVLDENIDGHMLWAWGAGTVKDMPGVFSVWMKADRDDFPVFISYGIRKEVKVGREWKRYEVVNPKLPGPFVYSPVTISFSKVPGTLWIDDLQAEFLPAVDEAKVKEGALFATPYKPSELDKSKFNDQVRTVEAARPPEIVVPVLPAGCDPAAGLDSWIDHAVKVDAFHKHGDAKNPPKEKTEAYLACDSKNLYIGARCKVGDLKKITPKGDLLEINTDPTGRGRKFTQFQFFAYSDGSRHDSGFGMDTQWDGNWKSDVKLNDKTSSIDYTLTIPFTNLTHPELISRWIMNLHRYDSATKEVSTLIKSDLPSFANPQLWPFVKFPEKIMKQYALGVTGGTYSDNSVMLDVANNSGAERQVELELLAGKTLEKRKITLKPGVTPVSFPVRLENPKIEAKIAENGIAICNQFCVLEKRNPVSMLGRLSYYMNEKEAVFKVRVNVADSEKMDAVLSVAGETVKMTASPEFKIAVPLKNIPDGTYTATLSLMKDGRKVAETSAQLIKRPYKDGAAQVNHFTRSLMHDGKQVFQFAPFFVFVKHMRKEGVIGAIDLLDRYGFKFVHILVDNRAVDQSLWALERAQEKGMKVMLWTKYDEMSDEAAADLRKKLDFPNVISQMVMDEPELAISSDKALAYLRKMRPLYPYHPVHMNNTVLGIPNRYADLETDILMLDDYLTNTERRTVSSVVDATDIMMKAGREEGKPCFYFIVGGNFPLHYKEPSYAEQVAQTYGNIAAGCTGLSFFYGMPVTPGNWKAYIQLNKEILSLNDVLLSEEEITQATSSGDPKLLRCITKKHDGYVYLVSCNIDAKDAGKVTFTLPAGYKYVKADSGFVDKLFGSDDADVEVLFENRRIDVKDGKFTDEFSGHSRHVYKVKIK